MDSEQNTSCSAGQSARGTGSARTRCEESVPPHLCNPTDHVTLS